MGIHITALIVALAVAALGLFGNIFLDRWKHHQERRTIAAAIAGELGAYLDLIRADETPSNFRKIATLDLDTRQKRLRTLHHPPTGHPVFEKVADKIGGLGRSRCHGDIGHLQRHIQRALDANEPDIRKLFCCAQ